MSSLSSVEIVLASASPRRRDLLTAAGLTFRVMESRVEECACTQSVEQMVARLAREKAEDVAARLDVPGATSAAILVIGADTVVECSGEILGKPGGAVDARRMLSLLSGREHRVLTGLVVGLIGPDGQTWRSAVEQTRVRFSTLSSAVIDSYVASGEPLDKAGAYGIQGRAALFIEGIDGCYFNVVGLPLHRLAVLCRSMRVELMATTSTVL